MQIEKSGKRERRNEVVKRGLYVIAVDSFAEGNAIVYAMKKIRYLRSKLSFFVDHKSSVDIRWHVTNFIPWFDFFLNKTTDTSLMAG